MLLRNRLKPALFACLLVLLSFACREEGDIQELQAKSTDVNLYARLAGCPRSEGTLIAINGGPGLSSHYMIGLERFAGPDFGVVTYDQRGVGRSSGPPSYVISYDLMDYVEDVEAIRKAVGVDKAHLFGHYWGAIVALRYATVYPERVGSIVIFGGAPPTWDWLVDTNSRIVKRIEALIEEGIINIEDFTQGSPEWWKEIIKVYFSDPNFWFAPADDIAPELNYNVAQLTWKAMGRYDLTAELAKVKHRVLILFGEDDPAGRPMAVATRDALSSADVKLIVLEKCGHFWQERPDQFYAHISAFVSLPSMP
jgi:pimeloyl-ACP methyl ester carboxylesterase